MTDTAVRDMEQLRRKVLTLSALVEENARRSVLALRSRDRDAADTVIRNDDEIDALEVSLEEDCVAMLAAGPVAIEDVRAIVAALRIATDLERISDLAANIARHIDDVGSNEQAVLPLELLRMAECALSMLSAALDALVDLEAASARRVCELDDEVDTLYWTVQGIVRERIRSAPDMTDRMLGVLGVARHLERIADSATNIAEEIVFMTSGDIIRHRS
jgi:phosphate transport system protein